MILVGFAVPVLLEELLSGVEVAMKALLTTCRGWQDALGFSTVAPIVNGIERPGANVPSVHETVRPLPVQRLSLMPVLNERPIGSVSVTVTVAAAAGPLFLATNW